MELVECPMPMQEPCSWAVLAEIHRRRENKLPLC